MRDVNPEQFGDVIELFPDAALLLNAAGDILVANAVIHDLLGLHPEQAPGRNLAELTITPPPALEQYLRTCARSRQRIVGGFTLRHSNGHEVVCRAEGQVARPRSPHAEALILLRLLPKEAAIGRFLLLNQRIEELSREMARRQKAEQEARAQREWLHVTLSSIGDAVIATDDQGRVSFMNPTAEAMTGWTEADATGLPLEDVFNIVNEESRARVANPITRVIAEGVVVGLANHTLLIAKDGTERPIDDCGAPIRDARGRIIGAVLVFHDVTERRQLEHELRSRAEKLVEMDRRKDEWISMLAHELRNPLAPIRTSVQVLQMKSARDPDLQKISEVIGRQTDHMARLIAELLDVTRITRGLIALRVERLDLARLARTVCEDLRPAMEQAGLILTVETPETPVWLRGDATRLVQVLDNLLDNARKFSEPGGKVNVQLNADFAACEAAIHICDSGTGIAPELLGRLFEPLSQADRSLHRSKGGLGLGLALVKGLVELHGGRVEALSGGPQCGAELIVWLPIEPEPAALASDEKPPFRTGKSKRVLIIEDNRDAANTLQLLLEVLGHQVRVAYTGPEGVQAALEWRPDVILSDIGLPGLDGYGVARELRQNEGTAGAKLIAVTGYGSEEDQQRARDSGFDYVIIKPAEPSILMQLLANGA